MNKHDPLLKAINVLDPLTGKPMRDRDTGRIASLVVPMTDDEAKAFEAERKSIGKTKNNKEDK